MHPIQRRPPGALPLGQRPASTAAAATAALPASGPAGGGFRIRQEGMRQAAADLAIVAEAAAKWRFPTPPNAKGFGDARTAQEAAEYAQASNNTARWVLKEIDAMRKALAASTAAYVGKDDQNRDLFADKPHTGSPNPTQPAPPNHGGNAGSSDGGSSNGGPEHRTTPAPSPGPDNTPDTDAHGGQGNGQNGTGQRGTGPGNDAPGHGTPTQPRPPDWHNRPHTPQDGDTRLVSHTTGPGTGGGTRAVAYTDPPSSIRNALNGDLS